MGEQEFRVRCIISDEENGQEKATEAMKRAHKVNTEAMKRAHKVNTEAMKRAHKVNTEAIVRYRLTR
jgi:cellobiose-specific phosphotransferase system component IIA